MSEQVKILFLSANPKNISRIRLDEEVRDVDEIIRMGDCRDQLELIPHFAVRPGDLRQALLRHQPHILHFSGHGSPTEGIILEDKSGNTKLVSTDALAALFRTIKDNLSVVLLNACYSAVQAEAISQVVDFTIGMRKEIGDHSAIVFSAAFYQGLAYGRSVQESFDLGVGSLMLEGIPESETPALLTKQGADAARTYLVVPRQRRPDGEQPAEPGGGAQNSVNLQGNTISAGRDVNAGNYVNTSQKN
jgi:CHAT domain